MSAANPTVNNGYRDYSEDNFEEVKVPVPWGHITGKWWGPRSVQPIIAIHGWQDNSGTFDNLAPILRDKGLSVYCIDLPGHGFSSHLPVGQKYYLFWDGIHYLRRLVKHFNWTDIVLMGHSLGGGVAFLYAAVYPKEVKKYVSIDIASPSVRDSKKMIDVMGNSVDKFLEYEKKPEIQKYTYQYTDMVDIILDAHAGSLTKKSSEIMLRRGMKPQRDGYVFTRDPRLKVAALGFLTIDQVLEFASRITCEVLNIRAESGIKFNHYDLVLDTIEKQAKKLEKHIFQGTHHLHLNNAETIAPCIYQFLIS